MKTSKPEQRSFHAFTSTDRFVAPPENPAPVASIAGDCREGVGLTNDAASPDAGIARVSAVDRDQYLIRNAEGELPAELTGRFVYAHDSPADLPCVGDWVCVRYHDGATRASIHDLLPRTSFLRRKSPGKNIEFQMIAANIDAAFIVQSCHYDFNVQRLERYLVMASEGGIEPIILLTKTDLISPDELESRVEQIRCAGIRAQIIALSNVSGMGIEQIQRCILPGKAYCLLGSSGVGKTTLINTLTGDSCLETGAVSLSGEGRHTTTRRQLIVLEQGGLLIDMPGMRELGMLGVSEGLDDSFADIQDYARHCRFANCAHTTEPGCAVRQALEQGELDAEHFDHYVKLKKESEFHDMSYLEKRNRDRAFGKLVRSVTKTKGRRYHNE